MTLDSKKPVFQCPKCFQAHPKEELMLGWICPNCGAKVLDENSKELKRMLFVDDRTKRIHHALNNFPEYEVTIATNVPEALRQMSSKDWDVISLDHDLTGHDFEDPDTPTCGMEIVRYIHKTGWPDQRKRPEFWIHSSNLFAAHLMEIFLIEMEFTCRYMPIIYKVEHMTYDAQGKPK